MGYSDEELNKYARNPDALAQELDTWTRAFNNAQADAKRGIYRASDSVAEASNNLSVLNSVKDFAAQLSSRTIQPIAEPVKSDAPVISPSRSEAITEHIVAFNAGDASPEKLNSPSVSYVVQAQGNSSPSWLGWVALASLAVGVFALLVKN